MSGLDHHKQNAKRGPAALAHTGVSIPELYPHRKVRHAHGETLNYPVSSQTVLHKTNSHTVYQTTSSTENSLTSGGFADIRIPAGSLQVVKQWTIVLELENKTAGTAYMPVIPYLFDRVEVLAEGGNVQIARWEPMHLYAPFRHVEGTTWDLNYKGALIPSGVAGAMGAGVKATYHVPILGDVFARNEAYLGHLKSDLYIRVWFVGASRFPNSSGTVYIPTLTALSCIVEQDLYAPHDRMQLHERAVSSSIDYRFGRPNFQSIIENLAPSTRYSFALTAVQGVISELIVSIRPANSVYYFAYVFHGWSSYELLDGSGASLTGGMPITYAYQKTIIDAARQSSGAIDALGAVNSGRTTTPLIIEFGNAKADLMTGSITGYIPFTGNERLVITTDASLVAGSYEVRIEYLAVARVNVNQGRITVLPS
jgi:hypothetical protein